MKLISPQHLIGRYAGACLISLSMLLLFGCAEPELAREIEELKRSLEDERDHSADLRRKLGDAKVKSEVVERRLTAAQTNLIDLQKNYDSLEKELEEKYQKQLAEKDASIAKLQKKLDAINNRDQTEYNKLLTLMQNKKYNEAYNGFKRFIATYPKSSYLNQAKQQMAIALREKRLAETHLKRKQKIESAAQKQRIFKERLNGGQLTLEELKPLLLHQSEQRITQILGPPTSTYTGDKWKFANRVYNPVTKRTTDLKVLFANDKVSEVTYWGAQ